jgi:hypothetical protein
MPANYELLDDFSDDLTRFFNETKLSDMRLLALLQRINLRLLILADPSRFELSTDWSPRLLHSNLILNCLTKFKNNKRLASNIHPASTALKSYTNPINKGGQHFTLLTEGPIPALTQSTRHLCLSSLKGSYVDSLPKLMECVKGALKGCEKFDDFDVDFLETFCAAGNIEMHSLRDMTPTENFKNPLFFPAQDTSLPSPSLYSSESQVIPDELPARLFWSGWYKGVIDGKPLDWELQLRVALIPNADWDIGKDHVAGKIEIIYKQWELETEIAKLKTKLNSDITQSAYNRLHNEPPDPIKDAGNSLSRDLQFVARQIVDLETEISKNDPDPSVIYRISDYLFEAAKRISIYWFKLGDTALQSTAKWAGPAFAAYLVTPDGIRSVSQLALSLAKLLGN